MFNAIILVMREVFLSLSLSLSLWLKGLCVFVSFFKDPNIFETQLFSFRLASILLLKLLFKSIQSQLVLLLLLLNSCLKYTVLVLNATRTRARARTHTHTHTPLIKIEANLLENLFNH